MSLYEGRNRRYVIENDWLNLYGIGGANENRSAYIDIQEIKINPSASAYLQQIVALRGITNTTKFYADEQVKASFFPNGFHVGDVDDGSDVRGCLRNEVTPYTLEYPAGEYDQAFRRVYAFGTRARNIAFMGYDL